MDCRSARGQLQSMGVVGWQSQPSQDCTVCLPARGRRFDCISTSYDIWRRCPLLVSKCPAVQRRRRTRVEPGVRDVGLLRRAGPAGRHRQRGRAHGRAQRGPGPPRPPRRPRPAPLRRCRRRRCHHPQPVVHHRPGPQPHACCGLLRAASGRRGVRVALGRHLPRHQHLAPGSWSVCRPQGPCGREAEAAVIARLALFAL
mmetsp:Transcript_25044/g.66614  ORF Transcript_25044/g.66614 Transcript_25044/m.66614 type:complete len:200 (+) Transcript_25044:81-680(+)